MPSQRHSNIFVLTNLLAGQSIRLTNMLNRLSSIWARLVCLYKGYNGFFAL